MNRVLSVITAALVWALAATQAPAGGSGEVILTISGKVGAGVQTEFSRADLEALGTAIIVTGTPWHDGKVAFEGVPLSRLMQAVGANGETAFVLALDGYSSEIPLSDFERFGTILALKQDGEYLDVADKGPLFVVYPFDDRPELNDERYHVRAVWQVRSIEIE